jgi:hypothetical protein
MAIDHNCPKCQGTGYICEDHPDKPFQHDNCSGIGWPCECNPEQEMRWQKVFATNDPERDTPAQ